VQGGDNAVLPIAEAFEDLHDIIALQRLKVSKCFGADARRRLEDPRKQASPEIRALGRVEFSFAGAGCRDDLLPDGEVDVAGEVEVLEALDRGPGTWRGRGGAEVLPCRGYQCLEAGADRGELGFEVVESLGAFGRCGFVASLAGPARNSPG